MKTRVLLSAGLIALSPFSLRAAPLVVAPCGDLAHVRALAEEPTTPPLFLPQLLPGAQGVRKVTLIPAATNEPSAFAQRLVVRVEDEARRKRYCYAIGAVSMGLPKLEPLGFTHLVYSGITSFRPSEGQLALELPYIFLLNEAVPGRARLLIDVNTPVPQVSELPMETTLAPN